MPTRRSDADPGTPPRAVPDPGADAGTAERLRIPKASELVAGELRRRIVRGQLREGDSLPPEADLMLQFGVSRPTLREAFRLLEAEHLIEIRRGARGGARVQLPDISVAAQYAGLLLQIRGTTLADVYEARLLIEPPLAGLCAQRCAPEHLDELQRILDLEAAAVGQDPHALARHFTQFHQLIVDGAGNTTLAMLAGMLANVAERHLAVEILSKLGRPEQEVDNRRAYRAHRKLLGLIRQRDSEGSEVFWRKHMEVARDYMLGEIGATTVVDLVP